MRHTAARASDTKWTNVHFRLCAVHMVLYEHLSDYGEFDKFHGVLHVIKYL